MRARHAYRGFTLIELIAVITILAILAAVALPRVTAADSFAERGYADEIAANLRRARVLAMTTGCDVQFTSSAGGYVARQRGAGANNHCAMAGAWATTVFSGPRAQHLQSPATQVVVFGHDGTANPAATFTLGARQVTVETSGLVSGP